MIVGTVRTRILMLLIMMMLLRKIKGAEGEVTQSGQCQALLQEMTLSFGPAIPVTQFNQAQLDNASHKLLKILRYCLDRIPILI